jgi:hypothetical protein
LPAVQRYAPRWRRRAESLSQPGAQLGLDPLRVPESLLPHGQQVGVGLVGGERRQRQQLLRRVRAVALVGRLAQDPVDRLDHAHGLRVRLLDGARHFAHQLLQHVAADALLVDLVQALVDDDQPALAELIAPTTAELMHLLELEPGHVHGEVVEAVLV